MKHFTKQLRKNTTNPEAVLWYNLRSRRFLGHKFRRQMPIRSYIVDFVCIEKMLVIEVDGGQHAEMQKAYDEQRTKELNDMGYKVLRFWNNEILTDLQSVLDVIYWELINN